MKNKYPNYQTTLIEDLEKPLNSREKKLLDDYLSEQRLTAGEGKVRERKRYALQFRDISEKPIYDFNEEIGKEIYKLATSTDREVAGINEVIKNIHRFFTWVIERKIKELKKEAMTIDFKKAKEMEKIKLRLKNIQMIQTLTDELSEIKKLKVLSQMHGYNTRKLNSTTLPTDEEIRAILDKADGYMDKALISLNNEIGGRPCETSETNPHPPKWKSLKIIDERKGIAKIMIYTSKTGETETIPIKKCLKHLLNWKEHYFYPNRTDDDLIFPSPNDRKKPIGKQYLKTKLSRLCKKAGIRNIYPYLIRHGTLTVINTQLPSKVAAAFGRHSEKTAARYTHLSENNLMDEVIKKVYESEEIDYDTQTKLVKEIEKLKSQMSSKDKEDSKFKKNVFQIIELLRETPEALDIIVHKHGTKKVMEAIPDNFK